METFKAKIDLIDIEMIDMMGGYFEEYDEILKCGMIKALDHLKNLYKYDEELDKTAKRMAELSILTTILKQYKKRH